MLIKTLNDLDLVKDYYTDKWKQIKAKYSEASGAIHFAFNGEFVPVQSSILEIIKKNHFVFADSDTKQQALYLVKNKEINERKIIQALENAPLNPDCRIEIIWDNLDYDLIKKLQTDSLVNFELTPQTGASIRIVLGIIGI